MVGGDERGDCSWPVGEGQDLAAEGQGLGCVCEGDTRGVVLFRPEAQEARHLPSTPSLREQSCKV